MKLFTRKNKSLFAFFFLIFFSVFLIYNKDSLVLESIRARLLDKIAPVILASQSMVDFFNHSSANFSDFIFTYKENKSIKARNEILENYFYLYKQLEAENTQLKNRLKFTDELKYNFISAKVIARNNDSFNKKIIVNVGSANKVQKWQMVLVNNQLVGRVVNVSDNTATILLITDSNSRIPVISLETKTKFIAAGDGVKYLKCDYLKDLHQLKDGEIVTTTNDSESIISDIIIGFIFKEDDNYYIKPTIDYDKIDSVQIIIR